MSAVTSRAIRRIPTIVPLFDEIASRTTSGRMGLTRGQVCTHHRKSCGWRSRAGTVLERPIGQPFNAEYFGAFTAEK